MDVNVGRLIRQIYSGLMQWTDGAYTKNPGHSLARLVRNTDIRRITNQPPLSSVIKSRRLTFFGHLARMDENAHARHAVFEPPPENWRRPPGRLHTVWMKNVTTCLRWILGYMRLEIWRKIGLSGDWCLCTALYTHSQWCMLLLDCTRQYIIPAGMLLLLAHLLEKAGGKGGNVTSAWWQVTLCGFRRGVVVSGVRRTKEVNPRRDRLVGQSDKF